MLLNDVYLDALIEMAAAPTWEEAQKVLRSTLIEALEREQFRLDLETAAPGTPDTPIHTRPMDEWIKSKLALINQQAKEDQ